MKNYYDVAEEDPDIRHFLSFEQNSPHTIEPISFNSLSFFAIL